MAFWKVSLARYFGVPLAFSIAGRPVQRQRHFNLARRAESAGTATEIRFIDLKFAQ